MLGSCVGGVGGGCGVAVAGWGWGGGGGFANQVNGFIVVVLERSGKIHSFPTNSPVVTGAGIWFPVEVSNLRGERKKILCICNACDNRTY